MVLDPKEKAYPTGTWARVNAFNLRLPYLG
jgi:hypothetical protein